MIKVNELRIGNIVNCEIGNKESFYHVAALDGIHLAVMLNGELTNRWLSEKTIEPIPLTPEILEKAGFSNEKKSKHYKSHLGFIHKNENGLDDQFSDDMDSYIFNVWYKEGCGTHQAIAELKYVHQLQNLYFSLTGEELPIELK